MGNKSQKNNYLVQGTILVIASFIARVIGMLYRIPLTNILGIRETHTTLLQMRSIQLY